MHTAFYVEVKDKIAYKFKKKFLCTEIIPKLVDQKLRNGFQWNDKKYTVSFFQ